MENEENQVEISKGIKNGCPFFNVKINGQQKSKYMASRELTKTDSENGDGVFDPHQTVKFVRGKFQKDFIFRYIDEEKDSLLDIAVEVRSRIQEVKKWSESLDYEEKIVFSS